MVKFEVSTKQGEVVMNLPTSIEELIINYLEPVTDEIQVADNYSLVALCYREKLSAFVLAGKQKKNELTTSVVPVFVKRGNIVTGNSNSSLINNFNANIILGEKLIMSGTALSLGVHVNAPRNTLNAGSFMKLIENDPNAYQKANKLNEYVYFVEFKLIGNSDIIGVYRPSMNKPFENPFAPAKADTTDTTGAI